MGGLAKHSRGGGYKLTNPLVTIGITAFNAADTIERAVHSALAQTWRPVEIVVVEDCSGDGTRDVLIQLAEHCPELRVFHNQSNAGVAISRNRILAESLGEFVAFFDDDDESLPERIANQLNRILTYERDFANGLPVICHTARSVLYPNGVSRIEPTMGERKGRCATNGSAIAERILLGTQLEDGYGACPACSQMARLSTYRAVGGFDPAFRRSEDTEINIRIAKMGGTFIGISSPLVVQTMTRTVDKSIADERRYMLMLLKKHKDVPDKYGMYGFCRRWIDIKYAWLDGQRLYSLGRVMSLALNHPWLIFRRLTLAIPNIALNRAFSRFHRWDPT